MNAEEKKAIELIKQHLSNDTSCMALVTDPSFSYGTLTSSCSGFMEFFLAFSKNDETMSITADHDVVTELAKIDKQRDKSKQKLKSCKTLRVLNFCLMFFSANSQKGENDIFSYPFTRH